jgi:hypothetical protein
MTIVDKYVDCADDAGVIELSNSCLNKGVAECSQLLKSLNYIGEYTNAKRIFKITGRYTLTNSFKIENFANTDKVCFKLIPPESIFYEKIPACYTFFYEIPIRYIEQYRAALTKTIQIGQATLNSIETILPFQFESAIVNYDPILGVSGYIGPNGHFLEDVV